MKQTELYPTHYIYRVGDQAVAFIHKCGDKGIISGALGRDLLEYLMEDLLHGCLREAGIVSLEGYVSKEMVRLLERGAHKTPEIAVTSSDTICYADNRETVWVQVTPSRST